MKIEYLPKPLEDGAWRTGGYWVALHRVDGQELTPRTAPGYRRAPYDRDLGARFVKAPSDWGDVTYLSLWTAREGGRCRSYPPLQPVDPAWVKAT
jgi:hypothetical protein